MSPKIWLITGASSGLGRTLTEIILEKGDIAVATARRPETLSDLSAKYPSDRLLVLKLDVTVPQDITDTFAAIKEKFGRLDVIFNNAGTTVIGAVELVDEADARALFDLNFWGSANVARQGVRFMREVNPSGVGGRILQNSSIAGVQGTPIVGWYCASKFAIDGLSESLAAEIDPSWNIKITIFSTGPFDTEIFAKVHWPPAHPAYEVPTTPTAIMKNFYEQFVPPGIPRKGMEVVYKVAYLEDPPLHFPLTKAAVEAYTTKGTKFLEAADKYASWSDGVDKAV